MSMKHEMELNSPSSDFGAIDPLSIWVSSAVSVMKSFLFLIRISLLRSRVKKHGWILVFLELLNH